MPAYIHLVRRHVKLLHARPDPSAMNAATYTVASFKNFVRHFLALLFKLAFVTFW